MKILANIPLFAVVALTLSACSKDKDLFDPNIKTTEYHNAFVKAFGDISADQSWDFYATAVQATQTRAGEEVIVNNTIGQPSGMNFNKWQTLLVSGKNNSAIGTHDYSLISPGNGNFKLFAVWYAGWYETYAKYQFEFGIDIDGAMHPVFGGADVETEPVVDPTGAAFSANPGYGADIHIPGGTEFRFYIKYVDNGNTITLYSNTGNSTLLYSEQIASDKQVMVIGFEDKQKRADGSWSATPDFNDIVIYLEGNPELPIPVAKRFMCEDLGAIGDFDFNDIIFDIQPFGTKQAKVTLQAAGGTLPAVLTINGQTLGEVHALLGCSTSQMVNTGAGPTVDPYSQIIDMPENFNLATFNDFKVSVTGSDGYVRDITFGKNGKAPCIISTPNGTRWMKESQNIKTGYPTFFSAKWFDKNIDTTVLY